MKEPILRYIKNAEKTTNKIRLPKKVIEKFGNKYYLELYQDMMILKPIKKED